MSEKKEFVVIVQSIYEEQYCVEADSVEEITPDLLKRKGDYEQTLDFVKILNIQEAEELEDPPAELIVGDPDHPFNKKVEALSFADLADKLNDKVSDKLNDKLKEGPQE